MSLRSGSGGEFSMKRFLSYFAVFAVGFAMCALVIYAYQRTEEDQAAKDLVLELSRGPEGTVQPTSSVAEAAAKVSGAVVNIDTIHERVVDVPVGPLGLFRERHRVYPKGVASGVLIDDKGYVLTNCHVVQDATAIRVTLEDGRSFDAEIIGKDKLSDLAVLKVDGQDLPEAVLGDSSKLHVGDWAIAVGNPLGFESSVSLGVISATERANVEIQDQVLEKVIQTDAAINLGNSGGALANINGELIGINTAIASPSGGSIGIGFAIPINSARQVAAELIDRGYVRRPWTGIAETIPLSRIHPSNRERWLGYSGDDGVLLWRMYRGSPADKAGLELGDVIVELDGRKIQTGDDITAALRGMSIGATVKIVFYRSGEKKEATMKLTEPPPELERGQ